MAPYFGPASAECLGKIPLHYSAFGVHHSIFKNENGIFLLF